MITDPKQNILIERIEINLLLEAIFQRYGYDFRNYAFTHVKRRLKNRLDLGDYGNFAQMQHCILHDQSCFEQILLDLSINVTEMFRDPGFYLEVRNSLLPHLQTYPFIKVWHAGCSAGQEVYSMAILLEEEEMKERTQIYATDFNELILKKAREGIYPIEMVKDYTRNYQLAGGKYSLADYYTALYDSVCMKRSLKEKVLFSSHNLVTDSVFGEMNVIFCRNVLIYFNLELQNRVIELFYESLVPGGFLCLGSKESLKRTDFNDLFEPVVGKQKIYRKKRCVIAQAGN